MLHPQQLVITVLTASSALVTIEYFTEVNNPQIDNGFTAH